MPLSEVSEFEMFPLLSFSVWLGQAIGSFRYRGLHSVGDQFCISRLRFVYRES